jgi:hypothetical protein
LAGLKNGELLTTAEDDDFDVFITGDQTLPCEQNLTARRVAVVVLSSMDWHNPQGQFATRPRRVRQRSALFLSGSRMRQL